MHVAGSFVRLLRERALENPQQRVFTYLTDGERNEEQVTYGELDRRARAIGALLQGTCAPAPGARVVLLYPPGLDYIAAFFGCLYGGYVAVPAYPPDPSRLQRTLPRLQAIVSDAEAEIVLTTTMIASMIEGLAAFAPELGRLRWVATDALADGLERAWHATDANAETLAFLQYTSGSTGTPKGVMLTHGNLLANEEAIRTVFKLDRDSVGVGWLPLYHDMGLIGNVLQTIYVGFHCVLMSPLDFLQRPMRWLEAISKYRATISGGPNFAYELCVRKSTREDRKRLNLGSWSLAFSGAEPVRRESLDRFAQTFADCGFRRNAFLPCYGLAEATLIVCGKPMGTDYRVEELDGASLQEGRAVAARAGLASKEIVSCGRGIEGTNVLVVDPASCLPCPDGHVGEIWVAGPHVAVGYWNDPEKSQRTFGAALASAPTEELASARYLRTGDLGFVCDGEIFVSGRLKDLIILHGRNYYPQDIEGVVEESSATLRQGGSAAFAIPIDGEERVVVVAEVVRVKPGVELDADAIFDAVRGAVSEAFGISLHAVVLVAQGGVPKTSSGKIQRHACKAGYLEGTLDVVGVRAAVNAVSEPTSEPLLTRAELDAVAKASQLSLVEAHLRVEIARVMRVAPATIDMAAPVRAMGLDSLMAVDVGYAIERSLGVVLPLTAFLREGSGRDLASAILSLVPTHPPPEPSSRAEPDGAFALSAGQESLWFMQALAGQTGACNIGTAFRLGGEVSVTALTSALQSLVKRHSALTATFTQVGDRLVQRESSEFVATFRVDRVDAAAFDDAETRRRATDEIERPFDLERGPVFRVTLLSRSPREHVLVFAAHHAVADLWSFVVLLSELRGLYPAARDGQPEPVLPPTGPYRTFVAWQEDYLRHGSERDWAYWQERLEDAPDLDLPTDRPRPAVKTFRGGTVPVRLPKALAAQVAELAKREGTTSYAVLLASFQLLMARYSGQERFVVGSPVAGRPRASFERTVGYFVNPLPLCADLSGEPSARELVRRTREVVLSSLEHQNFPFARAVERLTHKRDNSRTPLFQTMFVLEKAYVRDESKLTMAALDASSESVDFAGLELGAFALAKRTAVFDLTLGLAQGAETFEGMIEFNADLFDRETIERMGTHFEMLLSGFVTRPDEVVWTLPLITDAERRLLLVEWQGPAAPAMRAASIPALFEEQVARRPDALALQFGQETLSYAALNRRANQLAHWLVARGVGAQSRVVTWLDRSPDMIVAALAVMKAGGAYVPVDPSSPLARVAFTVRDSGARVVLSTRAVAGRIGDPFADGQDEGTLVCLDDASLRERVALESTDDPRAGVLAEHAAYVIYTSGTTGEPKASFAEHRQLAALVAWYHRRYGVRAEDRLTQLAGPAFDASVYETWPALLGGASLHIVDEETRLSPELLRAWLVSRAITICFAPTALAELLLDETDWKGAALRYLLAAGDRLTRRPTADHPFVVTNGYGPSECTIQATVADVEVGGNGRAPSIGKPIDGCFVYVLDKHFQPMPIGVPGELFIGGQGVARGYVNRPALTAEKFLKDPFCGEAGASMYRTGDVARFLPDGDLEFVGRLDNQVKLRGLRIELGEIESALLGHASVREAVVLAREDVPGRKRLIAYVTVRRDASPPTSSALTAHLKLGLPEYMVPSAIVVVSALPMTRNGKIDRSALPAPEAATDATPPKAHDGGTRDAMENKLCQVVADVLGLPHVGVHDKFFEIGASSLDLMKLQRRLERDLLVHVPVATFFERTSVGEIAPVIRALVEAHAGGSDPGLSIDAIEEPAHVPETTKIAIIGMSGRFSGAGSVTELWQSVVNGRDCLTRFAPEDAKASVLLPEGAAHPRFVGAEGLLEQTGVDQELWRPSADTRGLDLQSKLFLDSVLAAFEDAGHDPWSYPGRVALYGGASSIPLVEAILGGPLAKRASALWAQMTLAPDTLPMRAAHTFGFRAEAMSVNTACSTGLSAVHLACQSLLGGSSDLAVAVAANVPSLQGVGYVREEGTILSEDGYVRPFDARANGVVVGHGVGAVLLKPLDAALRDGDTVYAVIRATATNNDGHAKVGYTAPGVAGQVDVIAAAHARAGISAGEIGYVETHGTGTKLGDPVEVTALTRAFRRSTDKRGFCALGAVKANVGHLDGVAGMVGLMKTALVLHHETVPPLTNFESPNPELQLEETPFTLPTEARDWKRSERPRMAAVSSFGIGGTNVHAILEEAPAKSASSLPARKFFVVRLSARTDEALVATSNEIAAIVADAPAAEVADVAYTLNTRRLGWPVTRTVVASGGESLARALRERPRARAAPKRPIGLAFVYTGMGANPAGLGASLYATEPVFRDHVDACGAVLGPSGFDVHAALVRASVNETLSVGLFGAALFTFETALDRLLASWKIRPSCVLGHSIGEYAAAVSANVLSLGDALAVVAVRCRAMDAMPEGAMLVATCGGDAAADFARRAEVTIAALNGPSATVFCGSPANIERLRKELRARRIATVKLPVDRALHSSDVDAVLPSLVGAFRKATLRHPSTRFVSTVDGAFVEGQLTTASYWADQMRRPVQFARAVGAASSDDVNVFVEIGPTGGLVPLIAANAGPDVVCLPAFEGSADGRALYELVGRLLELDVTVDWRGWYAGETRRRVPLPIHPRPRTEPLFPDLRDRRAPAAPEPRVEKALPPIATPHIESHVSTLAMNTSIEDRISSLWKDALKLETIDPRAHFLELGGSSLLAVQLVANMRDAFGLDIGLAEVFATPTVEGLAQLVASKIGDASEAEPPSEKRPIHAVHVAIGHADAARREAIPTSAERVLTAVQRRVLAADSDPSWGPAVVNMAGAVRIRGSLDPQRLARALKAIVRRHEILHTKVFRRENAYALEAVFKASDVQLGSVWCDAESTDARLDEVRAAIAERVAQPFDLAREIPVRAFLFHVSDDDGILALVVHHVAVDAPSLKIILQETLQSYLGATLSEQGPSYAAFAARQADEILGDTGSAHVRELSAIIERSPRLRAAIDGDGGARADASVSFSLDPNIGSAIAAVRRERGVSTFLVVASALAAAMGDTFRSPSLVLSTPWGNRDRPEHVGLVGYVAHCMVMTVNLVTPAADPLAEMQRAFNEGLRHAAVPFEHVVLLRDERPRPLSDMCLVVHEDQEHPLRVAGLEVEAFAYEREGETRPPPWVATMGTVGFLVQLRPDGSGGRMSFTFPEALVGAAARDLPRRFRSALEAMLQAPKQVAASARIAASSAAPRSPLALRLDGIALSRAEVDALTATIESRLLARGVGDGSVVDVVYDNRVELVCAARAILRAGARATVDRPDAAFSLTFRTSDSADERTIALTLDMPRGRVRAPRVDRGAAPISAASSKSASATLEGLSSVAGPHVLWDEALPDNRAVAFALAALDRGGLVSDVPSVIRSTKIVSERVPLSLAYFPVDDEPSGDDTYRLLMEGAALADDAGLRAVFAPERHFHPFGGAFPDPTVIAAALASVTKRIELRAGSIVLPLHDPIRVAESWAMIDVLSGGRVGLSIATGWRTEDFVLAPDMFARRKEGLEDLLETLRALWRGESIERLDPAGRSVRIRTRPRPLQPELPVWMTCAGSPASFALAGELGTAILTMIATDRAALRENVAIYRRSFAKHWNGATGHVTVLATTFVDDDGARARDLALHPLERYMASSLDIGAESTTPIPADARRRFLRQKAERVIDSDGLIGDLPECQRRIEELVACGADEIACLVDFGVPHDEALRGIERIGALAERAPARSSRWARLPAPVPVEHRGRPEVWLMAKSSAAVMPAAHRTVLVEDEQLRAELASSFDEHPLSGIQFGIYFDELRFARATYNNPFVVRVETKLDVERLRQAIRTASLRHDMLRSRFVHRSETLVRVIDAEPNVDLRVVDGCDDEGAVLAHARVDATERFDLGSVHPLRVHLFRSDVGQNHLLLCLHHIAGDVVSGFLVVRDILQAYESSPVAPRAAAPAKVTYAQVAARRDAASPERDKRLQHWLDHVAGAPTTIAWPTAKARPARLSGEGTQINRVVPKDRTEALRAAARRSHVTVPTFLFATLQALLHVKTGRRDLLVGAVSLGRNDASWLDVVGPLFNMLPVRSSIAAGCTFEQLAQRTGKALVETMIEDRIGFADIVQRGQIPTTLDRSPLVQFIFNYIPKQGVSDGADAGVTQIDVDWGIATFDVDVSVRERGDDLVLTVKWSNDALDAEEGERFTSAFDALLACVVGDPKTVLLRAGAPVFASASAAFWTSEMTGAPRTVGLPTDAATPSGRAEGISFDLPTEAALGALALAERCETSPRAVFLAAFGVFLARHAGQDDLVVACSSTDVEPRLEAEIGGAGAFTMARLRTNDDPTFEALVARTVRSCAAADLHEPLTTSEMLAGEDRSESGVGVSFAYHERTHEESSRVPSAALAPRIGFGIEVARTKLTTNVSFSFDTGLFDHATIERFRGRFTALVASAADDAKRRVSQLATSTLEELRTLAEWNVTDATYPQDLCVHELIAAQAKRSPDAIAVVDDRSQIRYGELDACAEALAARLQSAGVGVETRVALAVRRSARMVVGLLGIQKSGGAYVPIDLGLPHDRIRAMLLDAGVTHIVTEADALERLPESDARVVRLDVDEAVPAGARASVRSTSASLAYVMFTSGSTGRPKGVQVTHQALVNFLASMQKTPGIDNTDVMLAVTTLSFDISGLEIYLPLVTGARVVIASADVTLQGDRLAALASSQGVTMIQATPTTYRLLIASGWKGTPRLKLLVGGEAVPADLVTELLPRCASVWNMYGPTETTIWSTCARLEGTRVVIGKPIANTQAYVLGPSLERLPIGVKGELYLGGDGLARGYFGQPELTAERFIANPFADARSPRLYRTGDIARFLPDGNLECLGRVDSQIKLRGFRIELGEIEHVLGSNPALKGAIVLVREDTPGDKRLVAYVVAKSRTASLSATDLADHAKATLPGYMVPSTFVVLDALPLNPSGKVDRKALAALDVGDRRAEAATAYEMPTTDIESVLSSVWSEVLGVPKVGRSDNFFDLGGNSLLALQAHGKLVSRLGKDFPILNLFTYTTVSSLAGYLSEMDGAAAAKPVSTVNRGALLEQGALRRAQRKNRRAGGES